jgi:hypothetical protein
MVKSSTDIHAWAYFFALALITISIPLSKFAMSVGQFLLVGLWLWSGFSFRIVRRFFNIGGFFKGLYYLIGYMLRLAVNNLGDKFALFFRNRTAVVLSSIYLLHIIGLIWTADLDYALKDLRIKLPLMIFPIIISTMSQLHYRRFRLLMLLYVAAVFVGTLISFAFILEGEFTDIRDISPFVGSIRFGLNISFAFFVLIYFILADKYFKLWQKVLFSIVGLWFVAFLVLMESVTSLSVIVLISVGYMIRQSLKTKYASLRLAIIILAIGIPLSLFLYLRSVYISVTTAPDIDIEQLDKVTAQGNLYWHDTTYRGIEDGKYVGLFICQVELRESWNARSSIDYDALTTDGHEISETLIRYLTSRDLRKDAEGVAALSDEDIRMIEKGIANYHYVKTPGLRARILKIVMGFEVYEITGDPSGSSVMQRIEYSKASLALIRDNFWIGVGTGDIEDALIAQYKRMESGLKTEYMFHAHNQFLAIFITFGIFGLLWFLYALIYPLYRNKSFSDYFFLTFFMIIIWSMLSDDTLETQAGVTLFAFFYSLLLFGKKKENAV